MVAYSFEDMRVRVLYFGVLKEIFGREDEVVELNDGSDVAGLLAMYRSRERAPASLWESLAVAVNREYARAWDLLREGDEVALLPPVSGGGFYDAKDEPQRLKPQSAGGIDGTAEAVPFSRVLKVDRLL